MLNDWIIVIDREMRQCDMRVASMHFVVVNKRSRTKKIHNMKNAWNHSMCTLHTLLLLLQFQIQTIYSKPIIIELNKPIE